MVVPSRQEAFGQTASEAHACGTPVVAFRTGGGSWGQQRGSGLSVFGIRRGWRGCMRMPTRKRQRHKANYYKPTTPAEAAVAQSRVGLSLIGARMNVNVCQKVVKYAPRNLDEFLTT